MKFACKSPVGFDQQGTAAIMKREFVERLTKLTNCRTWCFTVSLGESRNTGFADVCLDDRDNLATSGNEKDSSLGSLMVSGVVTSCRDAFLSF